ncbi:MAG TPA: hypothetical protein VJS44_00865 [Pyrinomonadaceae bacterium]|nr:hypothetical protein [Pyrinomonadaceae bacterium]
MTAKKIAAQLYGAHNNRIQPTPGQQTFHLRRSAGESWAASLSLPVIG